MLATIVIVLLVILDQLVKYLVKTNIPLGSSVPFLPGILGLTHIHNTGAAFSMLSGARWFFVLLTVAFVVFGMWVLLAGRLRHPLGKWSWVLVLGGAIGNLIDRCLYGYVVDILMSHEDAAAAGARRELVTWKTDLRQGETPS